MVRNLLSVLAAIRLEHSLVMYPACNWWSWILINILICSLFLDLELNRNALGDLFVGVFSFLHGNGKLIPMGYFFLGQFLQRIVVNSWRCPIHQSSRIRDSQSFVKKIKQKKKERKQRWSLNSRIHTLQSLAMNVFSWLCVILGSFRARVFLCSRLQGDHCLTSSASLGCKTSWNLFSTKSFYLLKFVHYI